MAKMQDALPGVYKTLSKQAGKALYMIDFKFLLF
jgi:hypothetical protein